MSKKQLIDRVIEQMKIDIEAQDWTAIAELLTHVPVPNLERFLPENGAMWENMSIEIDDISHINE